MAAIRVLLVEDTDHVRSMLAAMLRLDGFEVVGQAKTGKEGVELALARKPDVVVMDYAMPEMNGLTTARRIHERSPGQGIIIYTAYLDDDLRAAAENDGILVCVGKTEGIETLERQISELCLHVTSQ